MQQPYKIFAALLLMVMLPGCSHSPASSPKVVKPQSVSQQYKTLDKDKPIILSVVNVEASDKRPSSFSIEAIANLVKGQFKTIPENVRAVQEYQGLSELSVFFPQSAPMHLKLNTSNEDLLGCVHGPTAKVLLNAKQLAQLKPFPAGALTLAVSGSDFKRPDFEWVSVTKNERAWMSEQARYRLNRAYQHLKKYPPFCKGNPADCYLHSPQTEIVLSPRQMDPVFIQAIRFHRETATYLLASFRPKFTEEDQVDWAFALPSIFLIAKLDGPNEIFADRHAPRIIYQDILENTNQVAGFAFLDLVGDKHPELVTEVLGNEWYIFQISTMKNDAIKPLWTGGGGSC